MHDRRVRLGLFGLILAFPPVIEAASTGAEATFLASIGRVALVEALVVAGLVVAGRHRRAMRAAWYQDPAPIAIEASEPRAMPVPAPAARAPRRQPARMLVPVPVPAGSTRPARPAIS